MALGCVDLSAWRCWVEDSQEREPKRLWVQSAKLNVPPVAARGVVLPPLVNAFGAVGLPDVLASVTGVGDEVDARDRSQRGPPGRVPVVAHHGAELGVVQGQRVEAGKADRLRVGDLDNGVGGGGEPAELPGSWRSPPDHQTILEVLEIVRRSEFEGAQRAVIGNFSVVREYGPESGPVTSFRKEDNPDWGRVLGEGACVGRLFAGVGQDIVVGRIRMDAR